MSYISPCDLGLTDCDLGLSSQAYLCGHTITDYNRKPSAITDLVLGVFSRPVFAGLVNWRWRSVVRPTPDLSTERKADRHLHINNYSTYFYFYVTRLLVIIVFYIKLLLTTQLVATMNMNHWVFMYKKMVRKNWNLLTILKTAKVKVVHCNALQTVSHIENTLTDRNYEAFQFTKNILWLDSHVKIDL